MAHDYNIPVQDRHTAIYFNFYSGILGCAEIEKIFVFFCFAGRNYEEYRGLWVSFIFSDLIGGGTSRLFISNFDGSWKLPRQVPIHIEVSDALNIEFMKGIICR